MVDQSLNGVTLIATYKFDHGTEYGFHCGACNYDSGHLKQSMTSCPKCGPVAPVSSDTLNDCLCDASKGIKWTRKCPVHGIHDELPATGSQDRTKQPELTGETGGRSGLGCNDTLIDSIARTLACVFYNECSRGVNPSEETAVHTDNIEMYVKEQFTDFRDMAKAVHFLFEQQRLSEIRLNDEKELKDIVYKELCRMFPPYPEVNKVKGAWDIIEAIRPYLKREASEISDKCEAVQYSDQMSCKRCNLTWDTNDYEPPKCKPKRESGEVYTYPRGYGPSDPMSSYTKDDNDIEGGKS